MEQTHWIREDSDLRRLNEWLQYVETAMIRESEEILVGYNIVSMNADLRTLQTVVWRSME